MAYRNKGNYISCRPGAEGHKWDEIPVTRKPQFGVAIEWRCIKCTSTRRFIYSQHTGEVLSRQYRHPHDWAKMRRDEYTTDDIRLMFLRQRAREQRETRRKKKK